jgi:hypothetical protein
MLSSKFIGVSRGAFWIATIRKIWRKTVISRNPYGEAQMTDSLLHLYVHVFEIKLSGNSLYKRGGGGRGGADTVASNSHPWSLRRCRSVELAEYRILRHHAMKTFREWMHNPVFKPQNIIPMYLLLYSKGGRNVGLTTLPPSCAIILKSGCLN